MMVGAACAPRGRAAAGCALDFFWLTGEASCTTALAQGAFWGFEGAASAAGRQAVQLIKNAAGLMPGWLECLLGPWAPHAPGRGLRYRGEGGRQSGATAAIAGNLLKRPVGGGTAFASGGSCWMPEILWELTLAALACIWPCSMWANAAGHCTQQQGLRRTTAPCSALPIAARCSHALHGECYLLARGRGDPASNIALAVPCNLFIYYWGQLRSGPY